MYDMENKAVEEHQQGNSEEDGIIVCGFRAQDDVRESLWRASDDDALAAIDGSPMSTEGAVRNEGASSSAGKRRFVGWTSPKSPELSPHTRSQTQKSRVEPQGSNSSKTPRHRSLRERVGKISISEGIGLVWDAIVLLAWVFFITVVCSAPFDPDIVVEGISLPLNILLYFSLGLLFFSGAAWALLDKRVIRRTFPRLEKQTFARGLITGVLLMFAGVAVAFIVLCVAFVVSLVPMAAG